MGNKLVKKRNWAFVLYPESAPENWRGILEKTGLACAVSPLHDRDLNPTGEPKKAHYHVILVYSGPTSYNVVKQLTEELNQPSPQALEQIRGYFRYLTHKDNPEKAQYSEGDIQSINGFNIADYLELTKSEVQAIKRRLQTFIIEQGIFEYSDFMDALLYGDSIDQLRLYDVASSNTYFFEKYISSRRNKLKGSFPSVDQDTGEVR